LRIGSAAGQGTFAAAYGLAWLAGGTHLGALQIFILGCAFAGLAGISAYLITLDEMHRHTPSRGVPMPGRYAVPRSSPGFRRAQRGAGGPVPTPDRQPLTGPLNLEERR
jgi:hypothetical protein